MIGLLNGYLINEETIRSLISTKVDSDSSITVNQDVNDLIDDDPIRNLLEPIRDGTNACVTE